MKYQIAHDRRSYEAGECENVRDGVDVFMRRELREYFEKRLLLLSWGCRATE